MLFSKRTEFLQDGILISDKVRIDKCYQVFVKCVRASHCVVVEVLVRVEEEYPTRRAAAIHSYPSCVMWLAVGTDRVDC